MKTLSEIKKDFSFLDPLKDKKAQQISSYLYIEELASNTQTYILDWDIHEVFSGGIHLSEDVSGQKEIPLIVEDRGEINKRFFEQREKEKEKKPTATPSYPSFLSAFSKDIEEFNKKQKDTVIRKLQQNVDNFKANIQDFHNRIEKMRQDSVRDFGQLTAIKSSTSNNFLSNEVSKICEHSFWELYDIIYTPSADGSPGLIVQFTTKAEIVLSYNNTTLNRLFHFNFGKFLASLDIKNSNIRIFPFHNNIFARDRIHPHVYGDGRVCFGTAQKAVEESLIRQDFYKVFDILATVLSNYNKDSPVVEIGNYAEHNKIFNPISPPLNILEEKVKKRKPTETEKPVETMTVSNGPAPALDEFI